MSKTWGARVVARWAGLPTLAASALVWAGGAASAQDVTVGWTSYPADIPVIADAIDGGKAEAEKLGVGVEFALSAGAAAQANAVDNLLALGVDVIAIDPEDSKAIGPSVKKANEAGVPVVMWIGDNLGGGETATLISSDEELGGYTIAKWGFEQLGGKGRVALVQGAKAHQAGQLRENGFRRAMEEYPEIELVGYGEANWMRDRADVLASDLFTRDPEIQFVFVLSDDMAKGVYSAASLAALQPKITGYNGDCETLNSVWNDKITATLYQGWRDIGAQVIRTSLEITQGKEVPPKIVMPTFVIDKAAMQQIQDGTFKGATEGLTADVKRAIDGCS
jgi:ribose transport system substrate-binding protein